MNDLVNYLNSAYSKQKPVENVNRERRGFFGLLLGGATGIVLVPSIARAFSSSDWALGNGVDKPNFWSYEVKPGDSVRSIAKTFYGSEDELWTIVRDNFNIFRDRNIHSAVHPKMMLSAIHPGMRLEIDADRALEVRRKQLYSLLEPTSHPGGYDPRVTPAGSGGNISEH